MERGLRWHVRTPERAVDLLGVGPIADSRVDALEEGEKERLERTPEPLLRELDRARRVPKDLSCLEPSGVVEEPTAARGHEERIALHLQQVERRAALPLGETPHGVSLEEPVHALRARGQKDLDRVFPRGQRVGEVP